MSHDGRRITLVSHGPSCLDGLTCAVVAARYFEGRRFEPSFASNREIDEVLQAYSPTYPDDEELWITDISWKEQATDVHLRSLVERGLALYWIDHHKSAIDLRNEGRLDVPFTDFVLDDAYAASRLLFDYLRDRTRRERIAKPKLEELRNLVLLADDVDRWVLKVPRSRELALAVRAMPQQEAFQALLAMGPDLRYPEPVERALERVKKDLADSFALAERTRYTIAVPGRDLTVVAAECDDYAGEIADRWSKDVTNSVFALYDHRSDGVSLRRTPDCAVDLSRLASRFGGGGHPAAAGCQIVTGDENRSRAIAEAIRDALAKRREDA